MTTKHPFADRVRRLRLIFFQIGLLIALGLTLAAFKWTIYNDNVVVEIKQEKKITESGIGEIKLKEENTEEVKVLKEKKLTPPNPDKIKLVSKEVAIDTSRDDDFDEEYLKRLYASMPSQPNSGIQTFPALDNKIIDAPEIYPTFPGGEEERAKFMQKHMQVPYDVSMGQKNITVYIEAVVEKDGELSNIKVVKNGGYPSAGVAAERVIKAMPKWNPGYQDIWPVRVKIVLPIKFNIN